MAELLDYKCPFCGGKIEFDSTSQQMVCPYCDSALSVDQFKAQDDVLQQEPEDALPPDDMNWETQPGTQWQEGETDGMHVYCCNSCGGEIIADESTAATSCPFCGNPVVMSRQFAGDLRPDVVIPFQLDKKAAVAALSSHLKGKLLLPKVFKDQNHIEEVKGVYVPFWLFDTDADADIRYRATRVRSWSDSNYIYTETSYYSVHRSGRIGFDRVPVDGSSKMADDLMESVEPYDFSKAVDFQTAYLAGYLADKYDVTADASIDRANQRIRKSTEDAFARTVTGYATVTPEHSSVRLQKGRVRYALYPVWILTTKWNGNTYLFAMNGQTGKFVGDLPVDKGRFWGWFGGLAAGIAAVSYGIASLVHLLA